MHRTWAKFQPSFGCPVLICCDRLGGDRAPPGGEGATKLERQEHSPASSWQLSHETRKRLAPWTPEYGGARERSSTPRIDALRRPTPPTEGYINGRGARRRGADLRRLRGTCYYRVACKGRCPVFRTTLPAILPHSPRLSRCTSLGARARTARRAIPVTNSRCSEVTAPKIFMTFVISLGSRSFERSLRETTRAATEHHFICIHENISLAGCSENFSSHLWTHKSRGR